MAKQNTYNPCDDCRYSFSRNNQESGMCKICELEYFKDRLLDVRTADVVPKSEVEKIADVAQKNIDSANERAERMRLESEKTRVLYENARTEIAREIFEEIERTCVDTFGNFYIGATHGAFAELKKKYTEGQT